MTNLILNVLKVFMPFNQNLRFKNIYKVVFIKTVMVEINHLSLFNKKKLYLLKKAYLKTFSSLKN